MAEYSRGSLFGQLRDSRVRRACARVARWPTPVVSTASVLTTPAAAATGHPPEAVRGQERLAEASRSAAYTDARRQDADDELEPRRAAVEAYCRVVCEPAAVAAAVDEALDAAEESDAGVLRATREAAAAHVVLVAAPKTWRERLAAEHEHPCDLAPGRLAALANDTLDGRHQRELEQHLVGCAQCQAAADRERQATEAFVALLPDAIENEGADVGPPRGGPAVAVTATPEEQPRQRRRTPLLLLAGAACLAALIAATARRRRSRRQQGVGQSSSRT